MRTNNKISHSCALRKIEKLKKQIIVRDMGIQATIRLIENIPGLENVLKILKGSMR
jgi:hypothetical protein